MNMFKKANYVCHLEHVLFNILIDRYTSLTLKTHFISVARHIITIATGAKRYLSIKNDENASFDITLSFKVVAILSQESVNFRAL